MVEIDTRVQFLKGVGETRAKHLEKLGIFSIGALLRYYPKRYEDWNNITKISEVPLNETVCLKAMVIERVSEVTIKGGKTLTKTTISDMNGTLPLVFFNNKYIKNSLKENEEYLFFGKVTLDKYGSRTMLSPKFELAGEKQRLRPIYKANSNLTSKNIEKIVETALKEVKGNIKEVLPQYLMEKYRLLPLEDALRNIHFPENEEMLRQAKRRLIFEELLILQLSLNILKKKHKRQSPCVINKDFSKAFEALLPFSLTTAQQNAIKDSILDMQSGRNMNRLIQGDVGSGKTAVAASLIYTMAKNGFQSALMVPTEILAEQHFASLSSLFEGSNIKVCLLTGSLTKLKKQKIKENLKNGEYDVAVGTHALITEDTSFNNLGLVITDEQHRFGVNQRTALSSKGVRPHTLVMSATPIPGTLAQVLYGDLDVSVINEYPKGRQPIESYLISGDKRQRAYNYVKKHLDEGRQGYIVCSLVEESEKSEAVSAEEYFKSLSQNEFSHYKLGLLHGKMKPKAKEQVMREFAMGEIDLLVCTTVVEVGIDVPNAAIMVIENAERFGLSQLHQLRGRIGRGTHKSSCILISDSLSKETELRLKILTSNTDGFKIADEDLALRGPGDFLGSRQHGLPPMKIADIFSDAEILKLAGVTAEQILSLDPALKDPKNSVLRQEIIDFYQSLN